jgi:hypothetical protein
MEFEPLHERRLPEPNPDSDGVAYCDSGHTDTNTGYTNSHTCYSNSDTCYTNPNSDTGYTNSDANSNANTGPDLHGNVCQSGADHSDRLSEWLSRAAAGQSLSV